MTILYKLLGAVVLISALFMAVNWYNGHQQDIGYKKAKGEYDADLLVAVAKAVDIERKLIAKKDEALNESQKREDKLAAIVRGNAGTIAGLRVTINNLSIRLPSDTLDSCYASVTSLGTVFGQCVERYAGMAEIADRHASDTKTLIDAWPR